MEETMSRVIIFLTLIAAAITASLFFVNIPAKTPLFFYQLGFTILFQSLFLIWLGLSASFKKMNLGVRIFFLIFIIVTGGAQFFTLYLAPHLFHLRRMSSLMTTLLLSGAGIEIVTGVLIFAAGHLLFQSK